MAKLKPLNAAHAPRAERDGAPSKTSDYAMPGAAAAEQRKVRKTIEEMEEAKRLKRELNWFDGI